MDSKDVEAGSEEVPLQPNVKAIDTTGHSKSSSHGPATSSPNASPLERLTTLGKRIQAQAGEKLEETYPRVLDALRRAGKLCLLVLMLIFVVMLASWFIALSHWFTVVFGHLVLRYAVPTWIDNSFAECGLDNTMIFAGIGAFVVNLPPFVVFLLSFPLTFDRTVLEGSAAPANEFIKRITPKNRYALLFMKYAPRLSAGPIGSTIFWVIEGNSDNEFVALDPLHAAMAGVAGEVVLTALGLLKNRLLGKRGQASTTESGKNGEEVLPMSRTA